MAHNTTKGRKVCCPTGRAGQLQKTLIVSRGVFHWETLSKLLRALPFGQLAPPINCRIPWLRNHPDYFLDRVIVTGAEPMDSSSAGMSSRTPNKREAKAYEAMEVLGLNRGFIKPILKELLKVYANEWQYIEAENYRLLADQAFEKQESIVKQESSPSPRRTRASTSATDRGKKKIEYGDTRSAERHLPRDVAKPAAAADAVSKPLLPAKVKVEKDADRTPETLPRTPVPERVESRSARDNPVPVRANGALAPVVENRSAGKDTGALRSNGARLRRPSAASPVKIDAQTLQETLRQVTSTNTEVSSFSENAVVSNGTQAEVSLPEGKTNSLASGHDKAKDNQEKVPVICGQVTQVGVPDTRIIGAIENSNAKEPSVSDKGIAKTSGPEFVPVGQPRSANVVNEDPQWQAPVKEGSDVLLLLADNYSEDEDEPNVARIAAPGSAVKRQDDSLLAEARGPHTVVKPLTEERQEHPTVSTEIMKADEELPEVVFSVEEDMEQLNFPENDAGPDSEVRIAERIRPNFLIKKEVPMSADGGANVISSLVAHELENTSPTAKRDLSDSQETSHPKRVKYDTEPDVSSNPANDSVKLRQVNPDSFCILEEIEICATSVGGKRGNLATSANPSPFPLMGTNRRKLILSESPSPETSPFSNRLVTNGLSDRTTGGRDASLAPKTLYADRTSEPVIPDRRPTSSENMHTASVSSAVISVRRNGVLPSTSSNGNGTSAPVANNIRDPEDLDDEQQRGRKIVAHSPSDISRGTEKVPIPYVNEYNTDTISASFKYIPVNTVFQDAYISFSLARVGEDDSCGDCYGDCLQATFPCACTRETGGVFAYTEDGCLKEEFLRYEVDSSQSEDLKAKLVSFCQSGWHCPIERSKNSAETENCKGHLSRKFIKECWHKCGCSMDCGNRVVQRGITHRLQIFFSPEGKGWGLRTLEQLPAGAFVCEYVGEILTNVEQEERNNSHKADPTITHTYPILLDGDWCSEKGLKDEEALCLDATYFGNAARFINHRCMDSNLIDVPVTIESPDRHYYHVAFFTSRAVKAMEELTWDYKIDFDDDEHPIEAFQCLCQSHSECGLERNLSGG
ncbi:hypothetical protein R1flu_006287 [Riccia fluitans]|uniref:SET domain-containing protein n=1 Tax=Riccia fluitans TaxID=41844 RepID=A0ABD1YWB6_9MARC